MNLNEKPDVQENISVDFGRCRSVTVNKSETNNIDDTKISGRAKSPNENRNDNESSRTSSSSCESDDAVEDDVERNLEAVQTMNSTGPPHSVFSPGKKKFIIFMTVWAGFFSPLSANIYFPALNVIASELKVSNGLVNLTLTTYMIFQGLAPTIFGDLADIAGRRPAYIIGFIIYIGACIGIALQHSFAGLLILRCLQSTGSSGTVALGSGVVADISTSSERGIYMGWVTSGILLGPAIGPILGGVLSQFLGWRSIFWFLVIMVAVLLVPFIALFPETSRNVVGDGSIPPQGWNMSLLNYLAARKAAKAGDGDALSRTISRDSARSARAAMARRRKRKLTFPNPLHTLAVVREKDMGLLLLYNSLVYTAFYDIVASIPYLFGKSYGFNDLQIGLCFIPFGAGCFLAPILNGRLLDWNFRRVARRAGIPLRAGRMVDLSSFPLERARVHCAWPLVFVGDAAMLAYGWVVQCGPPLAAPLVLQFFMGLCLTGSFGVMSVMLVDNYPRAPATATAGNNLVRCLIGAGGTAVIIYMIEGMGVGWCFTFIAAVVAATTPILWILLRWGPQWRVEREERRVREEENAARASDDEDASELAQEKSEVEAKVEP